MTEKQKQEKFYSDLQPKPDFAQIELEILNFWQNESIFKKSVNGRSDKNEYVFMMVLHLLMDYLIMGIY